jgi:hypothetical protein
VATGLHPVNFINKVLNVLSGTTFTATANTYAALHTNTGDPGAAGTSNPSSVTTRVVLAWGAAAAGVKAIVATFPVWASWAGTNGEVVGYISVWDALTVGNFYYSFALTVPKTMNTGDTLTLTAHSFAITPVAA